MGLPRSTYYDAPPVKTDESLLKARQRRSIPNLQTVHRHGRIPLPGQLWGLKGLSWQSSIHLITLRPGENPGSLGRNPPKNAILQRLRPQKSLE